MKPHHKFCYNLSNIGLLMWDAT